MMKEQGWIVDGILDTKYQEVKQKDVVLALKVNGLSNWPIADEYVVIILSNILDNALEACERCNNYNLFADKNNVRIKLF